MAKLTDEKLVSKYLKGDEGALDVLVERYFRQIYGFIRRYAGDKNDAEDITQEVFVRVWRNLKKFDARKNFRTWIFTIARNAAIDWLKQKKALPFSMLEVGDSGEDFAGKIIDRGPSLIDQISNSLFYKDYSLAVAKLPLKYGSVIRMRGEKDLSFKEISNILKEPLNTVKSRYRRGMVMIRKVFR